MKDELNRPAYTGDNSVRLCTIWVNSTGKAVGSVKRLRVGNPEDGHHVTLFNGRGLRVHSMMIRPLT